jgi:endonuclease/exonuclease/phosphatase family metal-dependent hydrolase
MLPSDAIHHSIPMLVMGDFNSLHDSGVYELMDRGRVS